MFMLKLSEQQKQYSRVQGRLPNVLKVRHILLAETDSTSSIYNSQTARFRDRHITSLSATIWNNQLKARTKLGNNTLLQMKF